MKENTMNRSFSYYLPTRIIFGPGKLSELAETPHLPGKKALIVIGASGAMKKHGYLDRVAGYLTQNRVDSAVYEKIVPNPVSEHVEEGAAFARENGCDFILGLGGGSTIDAAKSIAVMAKNPGKYWDYISGGSGGGKTPLNGALPIVAVPTTAGTGTEADPWTVITKTDTKEKIGWGNDSTFPSLSIIDPELMLSVPPTITAHTGMGAFFHAAEAYLSTRNNPLSDHLALEAISLITDFLPIAVEDGGNLEARTYLAWASTEAGICESTAGCISHHSIEHALSAYFPEVPHGAGLSMLSISYFKFLAKRYADRFPDMAMAMGEDVHALELKKDMPFAFIVGLKKLLKRIGLNAEKLSDFGVRKGDLQLIAENSFYTMGDLFDVTPVKMTVKDVVSILEGAY
jgi:alcohol dehydrogenase